MRALPPPRFFAALRMTQGIPLRSSIGLLGSSCPLSRDRDPDRGEPAVAVVDLAGDDLAELRDQPAGQLARPAVAHRDAVDGADGRDLGRGAGEEELLAGVEEPARDALLAH